MEIKPRQELQEGKKVTMDAKLVADAKIDTLDKELASNQAQKVVGDLREQYLIVKLQLLIEEVEAFAYGKYLSRA